MSRELPAAPNLEHLRKQAKVLLRDAERGDPDAIAKLASLASIQPGSTPQLADAQHAIARDYGFRTWADLKAAVVQRAADVDPVAAFVGAVKAGDDAEVAALLRRHPMLRARLDDALPGFSFGATALLAALPSGNRRLIDVLLDAGADINRKSHWWAGGFGVLDHDIDRALADDLIARGARIDIHAAAKFAMMDRLDELLAADPALVHARGGDGQTPLHVAPTVEVARTLLERGADIDARDIDHESTPAQYMLRDRPDVARFLVARGARTDFLMAVALGDVARVRAALDADPDVLRMTPSDQWFPRRNPHAGGTIYRWVLGGNTSAHAIARSFGHDAVYRLLASRTPPALALAVACEVGDDAAVRRLLEANPDLARELTDADRLRLPLAAEANNVQSVRLMLVAGWPVDVTGHHGETALHFAAWHGNLAMVRALLERRAPLDVRERSYDGTPLGWALHGSENSWHRATGDYPAVITALLDAGATPPTITDEMAGSDAALDALGRRVRRR